MQVDIAQLKFSYLRDGLKHSIRWENIKYASLITEELKFSYMSIQLLGI